MNMECIYIFKRKTKIPILPKISKVQIDLYRWSYLIKTKFEANLNIYFYMNYELLTIFFNLCGLFDIFC